MNEIDNNQSKLLLDGISEQAKLAAEKITAEADRQVLEIIKSAHKQADTILKDADITGRAQGEGIRSRKMQSLAAELKRNRLKVQEELFSFVFKQVKDKMASLGKRPDYADILKGWIVEGALGLGQDIVVDASTFERNLITGKLIRDAEQEASGLLNKKISIKLCEDLPVSSAAVLPALSGDLSSGVLISASNGRLVFNNLVESRLQRYSHNVRKIIYSYIQTDDTEEVIKG